MALKNDKVRMEAEEFRSGPAAAALWWGALAGPIGFAINEVLSYAIVQHACSTQHYRLLHFYSLLGILIAISGFITARSCYSRIPSSVSTEQANPFSRARWMAIYGMAGSVAFVIVNLALSVPKGIMSPCDQ